MRVRQQINWIECLFECPSPKKIENKIITQWDLIRENQKCRSSENFELQKYAHSISYLKCTISSDFSKMCWFWPSCFGPAVLAHFFRTKNIHPPCSGEMCLRTGFLDNLLANGSHFLLHLSMTTASEQLMDKSKVNKKQQKNVLKF